MKASVLRQVPARNNRRTAPPKRISNPTGKGDDNRNSYSLSYPRGSSGSRWFRCLLHGHPGTRTPSGREEPAMSYAKQLLDTYPRSFNVNAGVLARTIDALSDCAQACTACADDCLSEPNVAELVKCIRLDLDCADVCTATLRVASRQTEYDANLTRPLLEACAAACRSCGDECERHAEMHEHCRVCAEACRRCEQACNELLAAMR
jgi:Domain of Unknown Function (DUF326)